MAYIDHIIPESALEKIRAAVYLILSKEFDNQVYQFSNLSCKNVTFFQARTTPLDKSESASIIISTFKGQYQNQSVGSQHAVPYTILLRFMVNAPSTSSAKGYQSAGFRLEKLMMAVRYILMNPLYLTLGLTGIVEHTEVNKFQIDTDQRVGDASDTAEAEMLFDVNCEEVSTPNAGLQLSQSTSNVNIALTDRGYQYITYSQ